MIARSLFVLGAILVACSPPRTVDAELGAVPPVAARVCVLRPGLLASRTTMEIRDNARLVGATRGATYACWLAAPGDHQIASIDDDTGPTLLRARPGAQYWLYQEVSVLDGQLHAHLDWVDDHTANEMLDQCTVRVRVALPSHDDVVPVTPKL
jgi:hypothetical protein